MDIITHDNWYEVLIADIKKLEFTGIVTTKHAIGKRILEDEEKFGKPEYGAHRSGRIAKDVGVQKADIDRCIRFARLYPQLDHSVIQLSWHQIVHNVLPESRKEIDVTPVVIPDGKYQIIYTDPPWQYGNSATRANAESHYPTMSIDELCSMDVAGMATDDAMLFMWTTPPLLPEIWPIFDAWGFEYKTVAFFWGKENRNGSIYLGIGNYTRSNVEMCMVAKRGNGLERIEKSIPNLHLAKRLSHSTKPHLFRELIERMYGDVKRIELFARTKSIGWDVWGNEIKQELLNV